MIEKNIETKIINFIEDFGCITEEQLKVLFNCDKSTIRNILHAHFINKKGNVFVHKQKSINKKMLAAIDVLCEYKGRFKQFYAKGDGEFWHKLKISMQKIKLYFSCYATGDK